MSKKNSPGSAMLIWRLAEGLGPGSETTKKWKSLSLDEQWPSIRKYYEAKREKVN
jgi:hypothetical protein